MNKKLRARLLALGLGTAVGFGTAELTVRFTLPPVDLDELSGVRDVDHPMAQWAGVDAFCAYRAKPGEYAAGKSVNSHGFISTPELGAKEPGTLRVAFLGGSSTAGTSPILTDAKSWPWQVGEGLAQRLGRKVEIINGALPGFSTFESYGRLWSRIRAFAPDVVVVYHGWNDMYYFREPDVLRWRVPADGNWTFSGKGRVLRIKIRPHPIDPWIEWSSLLCRVRRTLFAEPAGEVGGSRGLAADWEPEAIEVFRTNVKLLVAAEQVLGCKVFFGKQATLITPDLPEPLRQRCGYELHGFDHDAHVRAFAAVYRVIDEEVDPERIIDLTHLSGDPLMLEDHIHPRPAGARKIAEKVTERLAAGLLPEATPPPKTPR